MNKVNKQDYFRLLEDGHVQTDLIQEYDHTSRLEYLAEYIFNFTTYETKYSELFASKALEVCSAINKYATFEYIKQPEGHLWFLLMVNMPFFIERLEWGCSIRGAWWGGESQNKSKKIELSSCGLFLGNEQVAEPLEFTHEEWREFIEAVLIFGADMPNKL